MNTCIPLRLLSWGRVDKRGQHREQKQSLRRMEGLYKAGKTQVSSTYVSYTTLIDAYAKQCSASFSAADAEAAEALLLQMEEAVVLKMKGFIIIIIIIPSVQTILAIALLLMHGGNVEEKGQLSERELCYGGCNRSMMREMNPLDPVGSPTLL
jgi:hypothetical protein